MKWRCKSVTLGGGGGTAHVDGGCQEESMCKSCRACSQPASQPASTRHLLLPGPGGSFLPSSQVGPHPRTPPPQLPPLPNHPRHSAPLPPTPTPTQLTWRQSAPPAPPPTPPPPPPPSPQTPRWAWGCPRTSTARWPAQGAGSTGSSRWEHRVVRVGATEPRPRDGLRRGVGGGRMGREESARRQTPRLEGAWGGGPRRLRSRAGGASWPALHDTSTAQKPKRYSPKPTQSRAFSSQLWKRLSLT